MTFVISRLCRDCVDGACVEACPVDCIYAPRAEHRGALPDQLYIDPDECIDCAQCEPVCPWLAIYREGDLPPIFADDLDLNGRAATERHRFEVAPPRPRRARPTAEEIAQNHRRWLPAPRAADPTAGDD